MRKGRTLLGIALCSAMLLSAVPVNAQSITDIEWQKAYGGQFNSVIPAGDGGYVAVGYSSSPNIATNGGSDAIIVKYNETGDVLWQKAYGGYNKDIFKSVIAVDDGYIAVGSSRVDKEDYNTHENGVIVKYNSDGTFAWGKSYGDNRDETLYSISSTKDGGFVVVGYSTVAEDNPSGFTNGLIIKYTSSGEEEWHEYYGGEESKVYLNSITETKDGDYLIAGKSENGAIIVKYDSTGTVKWHKEIGNDSDEFSSIITTKDNGFVTVGTIYSANIGNLTNNGSGDAIIVKYNENGVEEWKNNYGGTVYDGYSSVVSTSDGGYIAVGSSAGGGATGLTPLGQRDIIIIKYNRSGTAEWQKNYGGRRHDNGVSITLENDEFVVVGTSMSDDIPGLSLTSASSIILKYSTTSDITTAGSINGTYTVDKTSAKSGSTVTIIPTPKKGYQVDTIGVVDANNKKVTVTNNTFSMPSSDVTVSVTFKAIAYSFTEGKDAIYNNTDLTFKLDGDFTLVDKILVNGEELNESDYTLTEGSTIVTLKNDYLKTLKAGTYELEVTYTNGSSDKTTFKVEEKKNETTEEEVKEDNPKTLDNVLFYVGLGSLSIIGLAGAGLYLKKKRFN